MSKISRKVVKKVRKIDIFALKFLLPLKKYSVFSFFSKLGNFSVCLVFILIFYLFSELFEPFNIFWLFALYCLFLDTLFVFILKYAVRRKRYFVNLAQKKLDPYSFPSGHVSRLAVFFVLPLWVYFFPLSDFAKIPLYLAVSLSIIFFIFMVLTMLGRVVKGYHYFSDCFVGFLVGVLSVIIGNITFFPMLSLLVKLRSLY